MMRMVIEAAEEKCAVGRTRFHFFLTAAWCRTLRLRIGYRLFLYRDIYRDNIGIDIIGYAFQNNRYNRLYF